MDSWRHSARRASHSRCPERSPRSKKRPPPLCAPQSGGGLPQRGGARIRTWASGVHGVHRRRGLAGGRLRCCVNGRGSTGHVDVGGEVGRVQIPAGPGLNSIPPVVYVGDDGVVATGAGKVVVVTDLVETAAVHVPVLTAWARAPPRKVKARLSVVTLCGLRPRHPRARCRLLRAGGIAKSLD
jgi:hypothetical protein